MKRYSGTRCCPLMKTEKVERGDWVTEGGHSFFRIDEVVDLTRPCKDRRYEVVDAAPFGEDSGFDPRAMELECAGCGGRYFVFGSRIQVPA